MELPQPRPFGAEGKKTTLDFLSLCSPVQQDPRPPQGGYLKTQDFLQPLEQVGKKVAKEESNVEVTVVKKPPPPAPPPPPPPSVTRILPGGIGTYSISFYDQKVPKPEGSLFTVAQAASSADRNDENSNCSSYTGSGFTLWGQSATNKGKTGKENIAGDRHVLTEASVNLGGGQWATSLERPSQSSSSHKLKNSTALSSLSSCQPPSAQRNQTFMNMITSSKIAREEEDDDEEEEFVVKKEPSSHPQGNLSVKVDGKTTDQKPNTPRTKHSATEQRRRCKINDRFQKLREIIPHSEQKRDKASFLLEVIEYIQYLQEKVQRYEGSYQGWNHEPSKLMPWGNCYRTGEGFIDQSQCTTSGSGQAVMFATKIDDNKVSTPQTIPINGQNLVDLDANKISASKERAQQPELTNKAISYPPALQQNIFPFGGTRNSAALHSPGAALDTNKMESHVQSQFWENKSCTTDTAVACDHKLKDHEQSIESGTISISSVYSQGLLNSLTQALQNCGVDLSQASISVQIDLGKRAKSRLNSSTAAPKDDGVHMSNQAILRPLSIGTGEESDQPLKRLKTSL